MKNIKLQIKVSIELNEFGKNDIRCQTNKDKSFQLRIGYWEKLDYSIIKKIQDKLFIHISEEILEDEDCGMLYNYIVYWELPSIEDNDEEPVSNCCTAPFTFPGWPDSDVCSRCKEHADNLDLEEMEFLHNYESQKSLESLVDNNPDDGSWIGR